MRDFISIRIPGRGFLVSSKELSRVARLPHDLILEIIAEIEKIGVNEAWLESRSNVQSSEAIVEEYLLSDEGLMMTAGFLAPFFESSYKYCYSRLLCSYPLLAGHPYAKAFKKVAYGEVRAGLLAKGATRMLRNFATVRDLYELLATTVTIDFLPDECRKRGLPW